MKCDKVLANFLYHVSKKVNQDYYMSVMRFIMGYRECVNKYGWEKKAENDPPLSEKYQDRIQTDPPVVTPPPHDVIERAEELKQQANGKDYTEVENAEHAPEICNEFVTIFR